MTSPHSWPWRTARRSGSCLPFGPTTSSTSASTSSCSTPRPTPTLSANSPSLAAPASSPSASCTRSGNPTVARSSLATSSLDTVLIAAVPPVLGGLVHTRHGRNATGRGGRTAAFKFYELRDNLGAAAHHGHFAQREVAPSALHLSRRTSAVQRAPTDPQVLGAVTSGPPTPTPGTSARRTQLHGAQ